MFPQSLLCYRILISHSFCNLTFLVDKKFIMIQQIYLTYMRINYWFWRQYELCEIKLELLTCLQLLRLNRNFDIHKTVATESLDVFVLITLPLLASVEASWYSRTGYKISYPHGALSEVPPPIFDCQKPNLNLLSSLLNYLHFVQKWHAHSGSTEKIMQVTVKTGHYSKAVRWHRSKVNMI